MKGSFSLDTLDLESPFTRHQHALVQCLTPVQADPLHYLKICAVPLALAAHILRPRNGQLNIESYTK
jgi:hypothetical protein